MFKVLPGVLKRSPLSRRNIFVLLRELNDWAWFKELPAYFELVHHESMKKNISAPYNCRTKPFTTLSTSSEGSFCSQLGIARLH